MERKLTINDVRRINRAKGLHFFDADTIRFFGSRVESQLFDNLTFVTSEQNDNGVWIGGVEYKAWNGERRYTIRRFNPDDGTIDTVGEFGQYDTAEEAIKAALDIVSQD